MEKPKITVKRYIDWPNLERWLKTQGFSEDDLYCVGDFFRDSIHNGCFINFSEKFDEEETDRYPAKLLEIRDVIFKEYPDAANEYGEIDIWFWW